VTEPRPHQRRLPIYLTGEHPCSYLPGLSARSLVLDPMIAMGPALYEALLQQGFRRSGLHVYRTACAGCARCVPVRLPVEDFAPNRSQRRNAGLNRDVTLVERPARYRAEHYALYEVYLRSRHGEGSMADGVAPEAYHDFLIAPWGGETLLLELRLRGQLMAVAVTDRQPRSLSAVYTFFDPALSTRAPGTLAVLRQIELARAFGLDHLYLGYWIEESRKMSYKDAYRPLEALLDGHWQRLARGDTVPWERVTSSSAGRTSRQ
jgi:arginine-tRNA-protein transferase